MTSPALSFGAAARLYDAARPGYPRATVDWALGARPLRVLDLAAGTGLAGRETFDLPYLTCAFRLRPAR